MKFYKFFKKAIIISILYYLAACNLQPLGKKDRAEILIKNYLAKTLKDPHSYVSVSFDTLERTMYEPYALGTPEGRKLDSMAVRYIDSSQKYNLTYQYKSDPKHPLKPNLHLGRIYQHKLDSVDRIIKAKDKTYKGKYLNYSMVHTYRAKDSLGKIKLYRMWFLMDTTIAKITDIEDDSH